jgi:hypothetical protein
MKTSNPGKSRVSGRCLICLLAVLAVLSGGCATTGKFWPSGAQWSKSAARAARHPGTWVPLAGAGVVAVAGWDHDISDWARRETPLFGSTATAEHSSNVFLAVSDVGMVASALAVRDPEQKYWPATLKRLVWEQVGVFSAVTCREPIRQLTDRQRPNGEPKGFPSGHSTIAFAQAAMTYRNLDALEIDPRWAYAATGASAGCAALTAWARVEAGKHYPTDVLAGAALGNFVALLIHDAFLGKDERIEAQVVPGGAVVLTLRCAL